jgi:hypothetical protein
MYRIIDKKCSGKTSRLLLLAKENNGVVVCANPDKMRNKAYAYGLTGIDFVNYIEYCDFLNGYGNETLVGKPIFIDELDKFLGIYDTEIKGYTISED